MNLTLAMRLFATNISGKFLYFLDFFDNLFLSDLVQLTKQLDSSRPVTAVFGYLSKRKIVSFAYK